MLDGDPDERLRQWYEHELGMPIPERWWAPEWQSKPISEWPGHAEALRKLEREELRRKRRRERRAQNEGGSAEDCTRQE